MSKFLDESGVATLWELTKKEAEGKVGDILTTVRTDAGDKWLLCNGENINGLEYPDLAPFLPSAGFVNIGATNVNKNKAIKAWKKVGNYYVFCASNAGAASIWYSDKPTSGYKEVTLTVPTSSATLTNVEYVNGLWIATFKSGNNYYFYTASAITGAWTSKGSVTLGAEAITNIVYWKSKYCFVLKRNSNGMLYFYNTSDFVSFTGSDNIVYDADYAQNMYLFVVGSTLIMTCAASNYIRWAKADSLTYMWVYRTMSGTRCSTCVEHNGTWYIVCDASLYYAASADVTNTNGWKSVNVATALEDNSQLSIIDGVLYWVARRLTNSGTSRVVIMQYDIANGQWKSSSEVVISNKAASFICGEIAGYEGNAYLAAMGNLSDETNAHTMVADGAYCTLPVITTEGAYCYIKAKE